MEVPDFYRMPRIVLQSFVSFKKRAAAERHIFGSHEAKWVTHCEGYTPRTLAFLLESYGFEIMKTSKNKWKGTHNFEMIAEKGEPSLSRQDCEINTEEYLSHFLIDQSPSELRLLNIWMEVNCFEACARQILKLQRYLCRSGWVRPIPL